MQKITEALALAPEHAGGRALKATAEAALAAQRQDGTRPRRDPQRAQPVCESASIRRRFSCSRTSTRRRIPSSPTRSKELRGAWHEIQEQRRAERARSEDATAISLPDSTPHSGRQAPAASEPGAATPPDKRATAKNPTGRQMVARPRTARDDELPRIVLAGGAEADEPKADVNQPLTAPAPGRDVAAESTVIAAQSARIQRTGAGRRGGVWV